MTIETLQAANKIYNDIARFEFFLEKLKDGRLDVNIKMEYMGKEISFLEDSHQEVNEDMRSYARSAIAKELHTLKEELTKL